MPGLAGVGTVPRSGLAGLDGLGWVVVAGADRLQATSGPVEVEEAAVAVAVAVRARAHNQSLQGSSCREPGICGKAGSTGVARASIFAGYIGALAVARGAGEGGCVEGSCNDVGIGKKGELRRECPLSIPSQASEVRSSVEGFEFARCKSYK